VLKKTVTNPKAVDIHSSTHTRDDTDEEDDYEEF
jgi:hypothetical protein